MKRLIVFVFSVLMVGIGYTQSIEKWIVLHDSIVNSGGTHYVQFGTNGIGIDKAVPAFSLDVDGDAKMSEPLTLGENLGTSGRIYWVSATNDQGSLYITDDDYLTLAGFIRLVHTGDFYLTGDIEQTGNINVTGAIDASANVEGAYLEAASGGVYLSNNFAVDGDGIAMFGGDMYFYVGNSLTSRGYITTDGDLFMQRDITANGDGVFDTITANVIQADKVGVGVYDGNFGELWGDTLLMDTTVTSGLSNLADVVMDTTTGQLYAQALGGGTSYWSLDATSIINDTANSDTVRLPDGYLELGALSVANGRIIFRSTTDAGYDFSMYNSFGRLTCNNSTFTMAGNKGIVNASAGDAFFRNNYNWNTGQGGDTQYEVTTVVDGIKVQTIDTNAVYPERALVLQTGTIADNDATPDVRLAQVFTYAGSSNSVTITDLDNPIVGATYTIIGNSDTYTVTISDAGNFNLSAAWTGGLDDVLILYVQADNDYIELGRSDN